MEQLKKWRRDLHQIPELGLSEYQTAAYLRSELEKMGYRWKSIIDTGTIVFIDHGKASTLAFRSDIDALPINEQNDVDYKSKNKGCMHACGHDGHMSALLGFAKRLTEIDYDFAYNILLIFQPAEESPGAARLVVESGLFDQYHVKAIFGMHLMPMIDEGVIACKSGPLMAMCGELDVTIEGKGSHAGLPQDGIDSIMISSDAIHQYQTMIARRISRFSPATLNIGKVVGGTARNSVASTTKLEGTLRCYDEKLFYKMLGYLGDIHDGLQKAYGCHITWTCPPLYPPVINDMHLYQQFSSIVEDNYRELNEPLMLAEDFAYYQKAIPGIFFFLGTKCDDYESSLHTETFNFHEEVLEKAVHMYELLAKNIKGV
ncbi:MAG: M20 family metallopeptidase [Erysipelotrichaceae bacterium]|nr:M20 family metallopeptidase [Erysipelotrichaceae bacterium]